MNYWIVAGLIEPVRKQEPMHYAKKIAESLGHTLETITAKSRVRSLVGDRQILMYVMRTKYQFSLKNIADTLNLDHTTVIHGIRAAENHIDCEPTFAEKVARAIQH